MLTIFITEIKNRLLLTIFSTIYTFIICYSYKETLLFFTIKPNFFYIKSNLFYFIATNITDIFSTYIKLSYFIVIQCFIVFGFYHIIKFILPGLYNKEIKKLNFFVSISMFLWFITFLLFNKLILPFSWNFFFSFQNPTKSNTINMFFEAKLTEYIELYIQIYYSCFLIWLFFVSILILLNSLNNKIKFIKKSRKLFYVLFYFIATIITPPDIFSQIFLGNFFILFFEIAIIITIVQKFIK